MTDPLSDYDRAQQELLEARAAVTAADIPPLEIGDERPDLVEQLAAAQEAMQTATEAVADEFEAAWEANLAAVQKAKQAVTAARRHQADVETRVGNAARRRNRRHPVMNDDEIAEVTAVRDAVDAAKTALATAEERFKAGVTAEQLEG